MGNGKLEVQFLEHSSDKNLSEGKTCPMIIRIPTIHSTYVDFKIAMDQSVSSINGRQSLRN